MTPEEQAVRGERARQLLEDPLLVEAFQTIENEVIEKWRSSPASDQAGREKLWLTLRLLQRVKGELEAVLETGKVAQVTLLQRARELTSRAMGR